MSAKIVVVGSFNADLTAYVKRPPLDGETVHGVRFTTTPGGKGSNQAVAARRLGAEVTFIGRIGSDVFSRIARDVWQQEGIRTDFLVEDTDHPTGVALIVVDESGENRIVVVPGANFALSTKDVDAAVCVIDESDVLITQLEVAPEVACHAMRLARQRQVTTILNPAPVVPLGRDVLSLADYLTPNQTELGALTGRSSAVTEEAARSLLAHDGQTVVVTLGADGARYVTREGSARVPGYSANVVDTTGAGDAFNGALAVALGEGRAIEEAIDFANAAGAVSVSRPGAAASMPRLAEVESFREAHTAGG